MENAKIYTGFHFCFNDTVSDFCDDVQRLIEIIETEKIDVIHAHPFHSFFAALFASQLTNIKLVYTYHGLGSFNFVGTNTTAAVFKYAFEIGAVAKLFSVSNRGVESFKKIGYNNQILELKKFLRDIKLGNISIDKYIPEGEIIGELVENTVNGTSSIVYGDGVQMFALTATQKGAFLRDILSGDTMDALIDATKQFGGGAISALQSLRYMPIDASEVCTLSTATTCQIGSYTHTFSSAVDRIQRNDKMIN
jgi:hypothetical protein